MVALNQALLYFFRNYFYLTYLFYLLLILSYIHANTDKLFNFNIFFYISQTASHTAENLLTMLEIYKLKLLSQINGTIVSLIVLIKGTERM